MRSKLQIRLLVLSAVAACVAVALVLLTPEPAAELRVSPEKYSSIASMPGIEMNSDRQPSDSDSPQASPRTRDAKVHPKAGVGSSAGETSSRKPEVKPFPTAADGNSTVESSVPTTPVASVPEEIELTVPAGAQLPVVLLETNEGANPNSATDKNANRLLDSLAVKFAREVAKSQEQTIFADEPEREERKQWHKAATDADEQYRAFFGQDAYMEKSLRGGVFTNVK